MRFKFIFSSKRMNTIQTIKITPMFEDISYKNIDDLFTAR